MSFLFRFFIFFLLVSFSFSSFSFKKGGFLENKGFSNYESYSNSYPDKNSVAIKMCNILLKGKFANAVERSHCEIFTGTGGEQSILELKSHAEASNPLAIKIMAFLHLSRGYKDDYGDFDHEPWELYRYIYWQWRSFNAYMENMNNKSEEWLDLQDQEKFDRNAYIFPYYLYKAFTKLYLNNLDDNQTVTEPHMVYLMEDSIVFLKRDCPTSKDFPTWSPKEADTLIEFCYHLTVKFFEPLLVLEKARIKAAKSCKVKTVLKKTYPSHEDYYDHCPTYHKVFDDLNNDVAPVLGDDPQLDQLSDDIIATKAVMEDESSANTKRMSDFLDSMENL